MKDLGATVIRIHLQFHRFMNSPSEPNKENLARLQRLLALAQNLNLHLDLTGLACYRKEDTPAWYDALDEESRWRAQANFWSAISTASAPFDSVFCYDLINEPIVPASPMKQDQ